MMQTDPTNVIKAAMTRREESRGPVSVLQERTAIRCKVMIVAKKELSIGA